MSIYSEIKIIQLNRHNRFLLLNKITSPLIKRKIIPSEFFIKGYILMAQNTLIRKKLI